jgi:CheY-like chemotaxis protein
MCEQPEYPRSTATVSDRGPQAPAGHGDEARGEHARLDELRIRAVRAASHHVRTPLSLVTGAIDAALREATLSDATQRELAMGAEQLRQLATWLDQLADVGTWPHEPSPGDVRLCSLFEEIGRNLLAAASWRGVTYEIDATDDCDAHVDPRLARWLVHTVVRNAIEMAGPRGRIALRSTVEPDQDAVVVSIVVEPDGTVGPPSVAMKGQMRVVAEIVALHGGTITQGADDGTVRTALRIPVSEGGTSDVTPTDAGPASDGCVAAVRAEQHADAGTDDGQAGTFCREAPGAITGPAGAPLVLLVEDDEALRSYLLRTLSVDYRIVAVATAEAAREAIDQLGPDLIACDLIPVIVLTGDDDEARRIRLLRGGADDYIVKPFTVDELCARIANLLQTRLDLNELRDRAGRTQQLAAQLQTALHSRVLIEQAKAFIAADRGVGVDEAFEVMRGHARGHNMKLRDLAARVVDGFRP